ncbi:class I SAM-dependent methyltransferase [Dokdonella soli]|uniref:Class I SAM-dependent methyltransferase n=1 Tax=Dokdonella soli TaxID=529810 RepID=A0ABN1IIQ0_9GAMM
MTSIHDERFRDENGILVPANRSKPPSYDFNEAAFDDMLLMQREHFWYRGRHKFLLKVFESELARRFKDRDDLRAIDLGGGCGGWVEYLHDRIPRRFRELALGDGSMRALALAEPVVGAFAERYQIDLLNLAWSEDWDVVFLLDVLEHVPDHVEALRQVRKSLRPGGLLFVAVPALEFFWSYNDELAGHQRRYSRKDFQALSAQVDMELLRTNYFMFFLSPALFLSRMLFKPGKSSTAEEIQAHLENSHRVPSKLVNSLATRIFSLEAGLVDKLALPWGTSILAVFRRPDN